MVTGGHTPGTAQLAPTASTSDTPLSASNTTNSPDAASTAVTSNRRAGQSRCGSRASITARRDASDGVRAATAIAPIRARDRTASRVRPPAHTSRATAANPNRAATSPPGGANCASYNCSTGRPEHTCAPTTEPADVPTTRSASASATPRSASPATIPSSQATPVTPPPPSTNARVM